MPIYEYGCESCGHAFERLQKISDDPIKDCPECEDVGTVKKLVSRTSFVLKGGGWYKDHYGLKGGSSTGGGDTSSTTGGSDD
jgi:putative FmdB family regulatory protein